MIERLSPVQLEALGHVRQASQELSGKSKVAIAAVLLRAGLGETVVEGVMKHIQAQAQVVLHFHPDRPTASGQTVAESMLQAGLYRNQFETGLSNGGLTAFRGGDRDNWEKRLFGGAYQKLQVEAAERPKYGALDLMGYADGAAPRFGSCYFRLAPELSWRCSFTNRDSVFEPEVFSTIDDLTNIMASLLEEVEAKGEVLGAKGLTVSSFLTRLSRLSNSRINYSTHYGRTLDDYVEAQVHGPIDLKVDVARLVADPSFQGSETGKTLELLCAKYDIELDWHAGFKIHPRDIPPEFRGPEIPLLARHIAGDDFLNTAMIGHAAVSLFRQPELWRDWGTYAETLQLLKKLWHVLAYYGQPLISF